MSRRSSQTIMSIPGGRGIREEFRSAGLPVQDLVGVLIRSSSICRLDAPPGEAHGVCPGATRACQNRHEIQFYSHFKSSRNRHYSSDFAARIEAYEEHPRSPE